MTKKTGLKCTNYFVLIKNVSFKKAFFCEDIHNMPIVAVDVLIARLRFYVN
jgi:hypothetical protein